MELEEMKNMWQKMDGELQQTRILNEQIIKRMLQEKSKTNVQKMNNLEYASAAVCTVLLLVFGLQWWNLGDDAGLMVCYGISLVIIIASLLWGVYKIKYLSTMDAGVQPVAVMQQKLESFRLLTMKERVVSLLLMPVMLYAVYAVVNFWVRGDNIIVHTDKYIYRIVLAIVTGIIASLVVYRKVYFRNIQEIKKHLQEIMEFKND